MQLTLFQLLPKHCARLIHEAMEQRNKKAKNESQKKVDQQKQLTVQMPGDESHRKTREEMTM